MKRTSRFFIGTNLLLLSLISSGFTYAQFGPPAFVQPAGSAQEIAPIDMTGYWVSIVNEDWRWRMITPEKGDYSSLNMLNQQGRAKADEWDVSQDGSCKAFGAAGLMRMPTRLSISWETGSELKIETDAGKQTRLFHFNADSSISAQASLQGNSSAKWQFPATSSGEFVTGSLTVKTDNLLPAWLRRNGVPYSAQTTLTEYYDQFEAPNGDEWLVVTSIVDDPIYLSAPYTSSSHFRREANNNSWNPEACQ